MKPVVSTSKSRGTLFRTGARVLTSAESLRLLEEKEAQKKKEAEEKEQRKLEREEKKKRKEEKKQKAEARALKAAEKLAKQAQKGTRGSARKAQKVSKEVALWVTTKEIKIKMNNTVGMNQQKRRLELSKPPNKRKSTLMCVASASSAIKTTWQKPMVAIGLPVVVGAGCMKIVP